MAKTASARAPLDRAIAEEVRAFCRAKADPKRAQKYARYFKEGYDAYGVDHRDPEWDANRKRWASLLRESSAEVFLRTAGALLASGKYEEASFAILLAEDLECFHSRKLFAAMGKWFEGGIRNWAHTDVLCGQVLGGLLAKGVVPLSDLEPWRDSEWKYRRRAAPVMLIGCLDSTEDVDGLLALVEPLMNDDERVVQQGLGWFLREAWKRAPKKVEPFLLRHKDTAPRLVFQYATEKMSPAQKARFRRAR